MTGISAADGHTDPAVKRKSALEQSDSDLLSEESEDASEDETELDLLGEGSESGDSEHTIDPSESADDLTSEADSDPDTKSEEADAKSDEDSLSEDALKQRRSTPDAETSAKGLAPGERHWHASVTHAAWYISQSHIILIYWSVQYQAAKRCSNDHGWRLAKLSGRHLLVTLQVRAETSIQDVTCRAHVSSTNHA